MLSLGLFAYGGVMFTVFRVQKCLEQVLGRRVDLVMRDAVKRQLRAWVSGEAIRAT
jgi:predicted nucleotidyltransferase